MNSWRILLVDDDDVDCTSIQRIAAKSDFVIDSTSDLSGARRALAHSRYDCVLLDLSLPDGNGLELLESLETTPVIVLTGTDDGKEAQDAIRQGAQDYLIKGRIDKDTLMRAIRYAIERKQVIKLRSSLEHTNRLVALGQMAASVAHEINNPAALVSANLEIISTLLRMSLDDSAIDVSARIGKISESLLVVEESMSGMRRIGDIVRRMQRFARRPDENDPVDHVDILEVIRWSVALTKPQLGNEVRLRVVSNGSIPHFAGRAGQLTQVFSNLTTNAVYAIKETHGSGSVGIDVSRRSDHILISVEDDGPGIPDKVKSRVTEAFFTTKPPGIGTGLGMAVAAEIVHSHNGQIRILDRNGGGARVEVSIPIETGLTVTPTAPDHLVCEEHLPSLRVLIVDDEEPLCRAYKRMLAPHQVLTTDGAGAVHLLRENQDFDVIVCDLMMPEYDGVAVYDEVKHHSPSLQDKFIFCTGGAVNERSRSLISRATNPILEKPVSRMQLLHAIAQVTTAHQVVSRRN
ncbi:MAG: response regulator [Myxococcota bacterium]